MAAMLARDADLDLDLGPEFGMDLETLLDVLADSPLEPTAGMDSSAPQVQQRPVPSTPANMTRQQVVPVAAVAPRSALAATYAPPPSTSMLEGGTSMGLWPSPDTTAMPAHVPAPAPPAPAVTVTHVTVSPLMSANPSALKRQRTTASTGAGSPTGGALPATVPGPASATTAAVKASKGAKSTAVVRRRHKRKAPGASTGYERRRRARVNALMDSLRKLVLSEDVPRIGRASKPTKADILAAAVHTIEELRLRVERPPANSVPFVALGSNTGLTKRGDLPDNPIVLQNLMMACFADAIREFQKPHNRELVSMVWQCSGLTPPKPGAALTRPKLVARRASAKSGVGGGRAGVGAGAGTMRTDGGSDGSDMSSDADSDSSYVITRRPGLAQRTAFMAQMYRMCVPILHSVFERHGLFMYLRSMFDLIKLFRITWNSSHGRQTCCSLKQMWFFPNGVPSAHTVPKEDMKRALLRLRAKMATDEFGNQMVHILKQLGPEADPKRAMPSLVPLALPLWEDAAVELGFPATIEGVTLFHTVAIHMEDPEIVELAFQTIGAFIETRMKNLVEKSGGRMPGLCGSKPCSASGAPAAEASPGMPPATAAH